MGKRIVSLLMNDPDLAQLVEEFVVELPERLAVLQAAAEKQNWLEVRRLAHQLKGAGGSYGFPAISEAAAWAEDAAKNKADAMDAISKLRTVIESS